MIQESASPSAQVFARSERQDIAADDMSANAELDKLVL